MARPALRRHRDNVQRPNKEPGMVHRNICAQRGLEVPKTATGWVTTHSHWQGAEESGCDVDVAVEADSNLRGIMKNGGQLTERLQKMRKTQSEVVPEVVAALDAVTPNLGSSTTNVIPTIALY